METGAERNWRGTERRRAGAANGRAGKEVWRSPLRMSHAAMEVGEDASGGEVGAARLVAISSRSSRRGQLAVTAPSLREAGEDAEPSKSGPRGRQRDRLHSPVAQRWSQRTSRRRPGHGCIAQISSRRPTQIRRRKGPSTAWEAAPARACNAPCCALCRAAAQHSPGRGCPSDVTGLPKSPQSHITHETARTGGRKASGCKHRKRQEHWYSI